MFARRKPPHRYYVSAHRRQLTALDVGVLLLFVVSHQEVFAQGFGFRPDFSADGMLIEAPREIERLVSEAKDSIQRSDWSEATMAIGMLLGLEQQNAEVDIGSQDYFTKTDATPLVHGSMRDATIAMLDELPDAGMKVFELRYGVAAKQALDAAFAAGDWVGIEDVSRTYLCTAAGREAMWLVAEAKIGRGMPMDAAVMLDRLLQQSRARDRFGAGGFVLSAACWKAAGQINQSLASLEAAKKYFPKASVEWRNKKLSMTTETSQLLESIELGDYAASVRKETQPLWVGGVLDRNADTPAGVPLPLVNWKFPMHETDQHEMAASKTVKQKAGDRGISLIPTRVPIVVPPWVLMMTYDQRINAIHLKTGKVDWTGSFNRIPYDLSLDRLQTRDSSSLNLPIPDYLARRIWGEASAGQLSSDGRNVYSLSELPSSDASESLTLGVHANVVRPIARRKFNVLQAWSVEAQGKLIWEVGGETGLSEPGLAGVLFLGAPLAHESQLLILGELNADVYLFGLAPSDGHLLWSQQLVANQAIAIADDSIRRNMSCSPSVSAGCVICPTLSGQLISIDLASRSLRWAFHYKLDPDAVAFNQSGFFGGNSSNDAQPLRMRSMDGAVLISDGCVVHAPCDGLSVYAVDLFDGSRLWELEKSNALYVGAGWKGRVLVVSDQALNCLDIRTGKSLWEKPLGLSSIGRVAGRGVRNGDRYFLPMTSQEILEIDIEKGEIAERMRVKEPLGNLISTSDQLISLSPMELTAYTIRDRLRAEIDIDFAQGSNSSGAMQRRGKIQLAEGKIAEALDSIEAAYRLNPQDPEVRFLLGEVAMMAIRMDFTKFSSRISAYEELISLGPEKSAYLILLIDGLMRQKEYVRATEKLLELTDSNAEGRAYGSPIQETLEPELMLQVRQDLWAAARLAQLYESASSSEREAIMRLIQPRLDGLQQMRRTLDYYRLTDAFRWLPTACGLRLSDAEAILQERELLLAEHTLEVAMDVARLAKLSTEESDGSTSKLSQELESLLATANSLRFQLYNSVGRWTSTLPLAKQLQIPMEKVSNRSMFDDSMRGNVQGLQKLELATIDDFRRYFDGQKEWPSSKPRVEVGVMDRPLHLANGGGTCPVKQRVGDALKNWTVSVSTGSIDLIDPNGQQRLTSRLDLRLDGGMPPVAHLIDSIAIIETQSELIAMDTLRASESVDLLLDSPMEHILWRESFGRSFTDDPLNQNLGMARRTVITQMPKTEMPWGEQRSKNRKGFAVGPADRTGVIVATNGTIVSMDPRTGSRRWTRSGIGQLPTILQDGFQIAVLDKASSTRWIIDARDGRLISKDEWRDEFDVWCTAGRNVLSTFIHKRDGNRISFKLWDGFAKETLIERDFSPEIRAEVCEQERLVTWSASGELSLWDLRSGKEFTHALTLPPKSSFKRLALERFGEAILVITDGTSFQQDEFVKSEEGERIHKCRGPMIAIDFEDGHPLWENPQMVYDYRFPISQVRSTPAISLVRLLRFKAGGYTLESGSVALLDIRNGKLLYSNDFLDPIRGLEFQSSVKMGRAELDLQYRGSELRIQWTDEASDEPASETQSLTEIGKLGRSQLESGTPKEWLERLQSGIGENPFAPDGRIDQLLDANKDR